MERRIIMTVAAVAGIVLWFAPLVTPVDVSFLDFRVRATRAGHELGGAAWLLLLALCAAAVLAWIGEHVPLLLANAVAAGTALFLLGKAGRGAAWGLYALLAACALGLALALGAALGGGRDRERSRSGSDGSQGRGEPHGR